MRTISSDSKQGEREYFKKIGEEGIRHSLGKPFSDVRCGEYLADLGAIMSLLPPPPACGLDLGCGTGWISFALARRGHEITGVDISPEAIQAAGRNQEEQGMANVRFLCADYEELRFHEQFDFAFFYDSLHHAEDERLALKKAYEALKPGGFLLTFEPGRRHHKVESSRDAVEKFHVHEKEMHPRKIIRLARGIGFESWTIMPPPQSLHSSLYPKETLARLGHRFLLFFQKLKASYVFLRFFLSPGGYGIVLLRKGRDS